MFLGIFGLGSVISTTGVFIARLLSFWLVTFLGGISFLLLSRKINMKNLFGEPDNFTEGRKET
jgi:uncharacterized membrane protein YbhN (UPF0104 family)